MTTTIPFTQYIFPHAIPREVHFDGAPSEVVTKANTLMSKGFRFEIECKPETQIVYMDISPSGGDHPIASRMVRNGPDVVKAVCSLIEEAFNASYDC